MYIRTKELPSGIQNVLETSAGYHREDIEIIVVETVSPCDAGMDGMRGFFIMLNIATGQIERLNGSWGGANMFNPSNRVDLDTSAYQIPDNVIVIKGSSGGRGTFASIYCSPSSVVRDSLPAPELVSEIEKTALYCFAALKGGKYRRDELARYGVTEAVLVGLEEKGLIKANKAGARRITTEGRNADNHRPGVQPLA